MAACPNKGRRDVWWILNGAAVLGFLYGCWAAADMMPRRTLGILCWTLGVLILAAPLTGWALSSQSRTWPASLGYVLGAIFCLASLIANTLYVEIHVWKRREASAWLCLVPVLQGAVIVGLVWLALDLATDDELAGQYTPTVPAVLGTSRETAGMPPAN
jgi:hypothetical protein